MHIILIFESMAHSLISEVSAELCIATRGQRCSDHVNDLTGKQPGRAERRQSGAQAGRGKMAAAAVAEFQRAQSLLGTDRNASIDILHSIGKYDQQSMALERKSFLRSDTGAIHPSIYCVAVELAIFAVSRLAAKLS